MKRSAGDFVFCLGVVQKNDKRGDCQVIFTFNTNEQVNTLAVHAIRSAAFMTNI